MELVNVVEDPRQQGRGRGAAAAAPPGLAIATEDGQSGAAAINKSI